MAWSDGEERRDERLVRAREQKVRKALNDHKSDPNSVIYDVRLFRGEAEGEGTYAIETSADFSRENFQKLGLTARDKDGAGDFTKGPITPKNRALFAVEQKPLEAALTQHYNVKFPGKEQGLE